MAGRVLDRAGACCATVMAALFLLAHGWAEAHLVALTPLIVPGALWTARRCGDGE